MNVPTDERPADVTPTVAASNAAADHQDREAQPLPFPIATTVIAVACVLLFAASKFWHAGHYTLTLLHMGANRADLVKSGEVWRLLSSAFLHGSFEHLAVNMLALATFGILLERLLGVARYLTLYVLSALSGSVASAMLHDSPIVAVGASGAIWGLMAAGVALTLRPRGLLPPAAIAEARRRAMMPLVINAMASFLPGIDMLAHLGGGVMGFGLMFSGLIAVTPSKPPTYQQSRWRLLGVTSSVLAGGAVAIALGHGAVWQYKQAPRYRTVALAGTTLTLQVPTICGDPKTETKQSIAYFQFCSLATSPIAFEVFVGNLPAPLAPDELPAFLQSQREQLDTAKLDGAKALRAARHITIEGRQAIEGQHQIGAIQLWTWITAVDRYEVMLRLYSQNAQPAWLAAGSHGLTTLGVATSGAN